MDESSERFAGRVILVSGTPFPRASELARRLLAGGARLLLAVEPRSDAESLALELGSDRVLVHAGLSDAAVQTALGAWGRLDALVCCAASGSRHAPSVDVDEWLHGETRGTCSLVRAALPELRHRAGSVAGLLADGGDQRRCAVARARWLAGFLKGIAVENAKYGVRSKLFGAGPVGAGSCSEPDPERDTVAACLRFLNAASDRARAA